MGMTFLQQQSKLSRLLGDSNTTTDDQWSLADRKFELNRGEMQLARDSKDLLEFSNETISSSEITVPTDFLEVHMIIINNFVITNDREIGLSQWERFYNTGGAAPYYYVWEFSGAHKIKFLNATDGDTVKLYYFRKPSVDLDADSDESVHKDEYREGSVYYAASELLDQIGKSDLSNRYRQKYEFFVGKAYENMEKHYIFKQEVKPEIIDPYTEGDSYGYNQGLGIRS